MTDVRGVRSQDIVVHIVPFRNYPVVLAKKTFNSNENVVERVINLPGQRRVCLFYIVNCVKRHFRSAI